VLVALDLEAANNIAKQLVSLAGADSAGFVLGARVPPVGCSSVVRAPPFVGPRERPGVDEPLAPQSTGRRSTKTIGSQEARDLSRRRPVKALQERRTPCGLR